jgi:hypothetical protein
MSVSNVPFSNYGVLTGQLFLYAGGRAAFESPSPSPPSELSEKKCILLGGLSDGLLPCPYTDILEKVCHDQSWSLVQPIISSSYTGFGNGSLERDCNELQELMKYLIEFRNGKEFAIVGHSTGCQDAIYFLENAESSLVSKLRMVALQAPVSDREGAMQQEGYTEKLAYAKKIVQDGNGQEMLPRSHFWAPITAKRFVDLHSKGGVDDYFSSDYTDDELVQRLQHVGTNPNLHTALVAFSGSDEYIPSHVDRKLLSKRLVDAMNTLCVNKKNVAELLYLESGNHNLSKGPADAKTFVDRISEILNQIG